MIYQQPDFDADGDFVNVGSEFTIRFPGAWVGGNYLPDGGRFPLASELPDPPRRVVLPFLGRREPAPIVPLWKELILDVGVLGVIGGAVYVLWQAISS